MKVKVLLKVGMTIEVEGGWDDKCQLNQIHRDSVRSAKDVLIKISREHSNVLFGTSQLEVDSITLKDER